MNLSNWHWPQIALACLILLEAGCQMASHGRPRENYNFWWWLFGISITTFLLVKGGFFK